jgi:predicted nuclease with TOPRIM domain
LKKTYEQYGGEYKELTNKYESTVKEKMLMKLEKDRLYAKVENLEAQLKQ